MSLHDLIASDLAHMTGDTAGGFALEARIGTHRITGIMTWEPVIMANGLETTRSTFRVAEANMPQGKARSTDYGATLIVDEPQPYGARTYTIQSIEPESHGEVLLILKEP